jgi:hypothetical protein
MAIQRVRTVNGNGGAPPVVIISVDQSPKVYAYEYTTDDEYNMIVDVTSDLQAVYDGRVTKDDA